MNDKRKTFLRAQMKFILASAFTYAFFYLTRKNLSMAQPGMLEEGVVTTYQLGAIAGFALVGMAFFLFAWNASADGYRSK